MIYGNMKFGYINCTFSFDDWMLSITFPNSESINEYLNIKESILVDSIKLPTDLIRGWDAQFNYYFKIANSYFDMHNTFKCPVYSYISIEAAYNIECKVNRIIFYSKELDYVSESYKYMTVNKEGDAVLRKDFPKELNLSSIMHFENKQIEVKFRQSASRFSRSTTPYVLKGNMVYSFDETNDYSWILNLPTTAYKIMTFLCRRKNVNFNEMNLYLGSNKVGFIYFNNHYESEDLNYKYIPYSYLGSKFGPLFEDIINNNMSIHFYPDSLKNDRIITQGSYLALSSAFEFEYDNHFKIYRKKEEVESENKFKDMISQLVCEGKYLSEFKSNAIKFVNRPSLEEKIKDTLKHYPSIALFCERELYENKKMNINDVSKRFADQRNIFAHGRIKESFIEEVVYDYVLLEYLIYFMQLKTHNYTSLEALHCIKDLFRCPMGISPKNESDYTFNPMEVLYEDTLDYAFKKIVDYNRIFETNASDNKFELINLDCEIRLDFDDRFNYGCLNDKYVLLDVVNKKIYDLKSDNPFEESKTIIKSILYNDANIAFSTDEIKKILNDIIQKYDMLLKKYDETIINEIYNLILSISNKAKIIKQYDSIDVSNKKVKSKLFNCDKFCENIKTLIIIGEKKLLNENYKDSTYQLLFSKIKERI
jgi:hypothetical protein